VLPASAPAAGVLAWGTTGGRSVNYLGDGGSPLGSPVPVFATGLSGVKAVSSGTEDTLALLEDGTVMIWGENQRGGLGQGSEEPRQSLAPIPVPGLEHVQALASGQGFNLALLEGGQVVAWGNDEEGELGNGVMQKENPTPTAIPGLSGVTAIAAAGQHALALLEDGEVVTWGSNESGQLGNGTTSASDVPVAVEGLAGAQGVAATPATSFALLGSGSVESWGSNTAGELGIGKTEGELARSKVPVSVGGLSGVRSLVAGSALPGVDVEGRTFAILEDGTVDGWGADNSGALGLVAEADTPTHVPGLAEVTSIATGFNFSLALLQNGAVYAWGNGEFLGTGEAGRSTHTPVRVCGIEEATAIAAGADSYAVAPEQPLCASVEEVTPPMARVGGTVTLHGSNLDQVTAVHFGSVAASSFKAESPTAMTVVVPPGTGSSTVPLTVTTTRGTSSPLTRQFSYSEPPVMGECKSFSATPGMWTNRGCSIAGAGGTWELYPLTGRTITTRTKKLTLETGHGLKVACTGELGGGEVAEVKLLTGLALELSGCTLGTTPCASSGQPSGHIATSTLTAVLGWEKKTKLGGTPGLDFQPGAGEPIATFTCGSEAITIRGSVIGVPPVNQPLGAPNITFVATAGVQKVERLVGGPADVLEVSVNGGAYERIGLTTKLELDSGIEFNTVD
jgi:alpha-tubulin suppressor-like RCC1 family protein